MIVYRMFEDGGFVAGDTATERTSYAYPTSTHAIDAKRNPAKVAAEMVEVCCRWKGVSGSPLTMTRGTGDC